jgi:hypothetical protein
MSGIFFSWFLLRPVLAVSFAVIAYPGQRPWQQDSEIFFSTAEYREKLLPFYPCGPGIHPCDSVCFSLTLPLRFCDRSQGKFAVNRRATSERERACFVLVPVAFVLFMFAAEWTFGKEKASIRKENFTRRNTCRLFEFK